MHLTGSGRACRHRLAAALASITAPTYQAVGWPAACHQGAPCVQHGAPAAWAQLHTAPTSTAPLTTSTTSASMAALTAAAAIAAFTLFAVGPAAVCSADAPPAAGAQATAQGPGSAARATNRGAAAAAAASAASSGASVSESANDAHVVAQLVSDPTCASSVALTAPLSVLLGQAAPLGRAARHALAAACPDLTGLPVWEAATLGRGLALLLGPELLAAAPDTAASLHSALLSACAGLSSGRATLQDVASLTWAVAVVYGGLSGEGTEAALAGALGRVGTSQIDAGSALLLLDALVLSAAQSAGPAAAAGQSGPRPSRDAVLDAAARAGLSPALRGAVRTAYDENVPYDAGVLGDGALLVLLHAALAVPHLDPAGLPKAGSGWLGGLVGGSAGSGAPTPVTSAPLADPIAAAVPRGAGAAAVAVLGAPGSGARASRELARVKRDVAFHCRGDEVVGGRQAAANDAAYLLQRRLALGVVRPPDVDVSLPTVRTALVFQDDHVLLPSTERSVTKRDAPAAPAPPPPGFFLATGAASLERAARERWAPPAATPAGYDARAAAPGLAAARAGAARALGWQVERVRSSKWWGEAGNRPGGEQAREARLRAWLAAPRGTPFA